MCCECPYGQCCKVTDRLGSATGNLGVGPVHVTRGTGLKSAADWTLDIRMLNV